MEHKERIAQAGEWVAQASRVCVLTGAGVSAESGIPTFRDDESGYWSQFKPEEMASEAGYRRDPAHVWRWYQHRRERLALVQPNAGHRALAQWAAMHPRRMTLVTQNVDGLHQRAGSQGVLCLHGELMKTAGSIAAVPNAIWSAPLPENRRFAPLAAIAAPGRGLVWRNAARRHLGRGRGGRQSLRSDAGRGDLGCRLPRGGPGSAGP